MKEKLTRRITTDNSQQESNTKWSTSIKRNLKKNNKECNENEETVTECKKNQEPRTKNKEPENKEPITKNQESRTKNQEVKMTYENNPTKGKRTESLGMNRIR